MSERKLINFSLEEENRKNFKLWCMEKHNKSMQEYLEEHVLKCIDGYQPNPSIIVENL